MPEFRHALREYDTIFQPSPTHLIDQRGPGFDHPLAGTMQRLQVELARLSTNVVHVTVKNADHEIHLYAPDDTVSWIETVLDAVRNQQPLGAGVAQ